MLAALGVDSGPPGGEPTRLGGQGGVNVASGAVSGQRYGAATAPPFGFDESGELGVPVTLDRDAGTGFADGAHMRGTVAGDSDGSAMGGGAVPAS